MEMFPEGSVFQLHRRDLDRNCQFPPACRMCTLCHVRRILGVERCDRHIELGRGAHVQSEHGGEMLLCTFALDLALRIALLLGPAQIIDRFPKFLGQGLCSGSLCGANRRLRRFLPIAVCARTTSLLHTSATRQAAGAQVVLDYVPPRFYGDVWQHQQV